VVSGLAGFLHRPIPDVIGESWTIIASPVAPSERQGMAFPTKADWTASKLGSNVVDFLLHSFPSCGIEGKTHGHQIGFAPTKVRAIWLKWPAPSAFTQPQPSRCRKGELGMRVMGRMLMLI
jgi:hypothetical protein